jgi:hypothetical protein
MALTPTMSIEPIPMSVESPEMSVNIPQTRLPNNYLGGTQLNLPISDVKRLEQIELERQEISKEDLKKKSFLDKVITGVKDIPDKLRRPIILDVMTGGILRQTIDRPAQEVIQSSQRERQKLEEFKELGETFEDVGKKELSIIKRLESKVSDEGFTGTQQELDKYNSAIENYQRKIEERLKDIEGTGASVVGMSTQEGEQLFFNPPKVETVGVGILNLREDVPVTEFTAKTKSGIEQQALSKGFSLLGEKIGEGLSLLGKEGGYFITSTTPTLKEITKRQSLQPMSLGGFQFDIRGKQVGTPQQLKAVGDFGKYLIPVAGQGFFFADVEQEGRKFNYNPITFVKEEPLKAGLTGGAILTLGALKLGKRLVTPKIIEESIKGGKVFRLESPVLRRATITDKGQRNLLKLKEKYIRTPVTAFKQSPLKRMLGKEPELIILQKGQTYVGEPALNILGKPIVEGQPFLYRTGRVGKRGDIVNQRFFILKENQKTIPFEAIKQLPKKEQYLFSKLFKKTGREKSGVKVLKEEEKLQIGLLEQLELKKVGTGKSKSLFGTGSIITPKGKLEKGIKVFQLETGIKDVTNIFSRASGKVPVVKDILIDLPPRDLTTSGVKSFKGAGKKSSREFLEQLYKIEPPKIITLPRVKPSKQKPITKVIEEATEIPTESIWAGTGLYEKTSGGGVLSITSQDPTFLTPVIQSSLIDSRIDFIQPQKIGLKTTPRLFTDIKVREDTRLEIKPRIKLLEGIKSIQKGQTKVKERQAIKELLGTKQQTKQIQRTTITKIKIKTPKFPIIKISKGLEEKEKKKIIDDEDFEVFTRKRGKDIKIGEFGTLSEARREFREELSGTLRASGFISKAGKKLSFEEVGIKDNQFRKSRLDPFRIVQRKTKRIKTGGEIGEILKSRGGFF